VAASVLREAREEAGLTREQVCGLLDPPVVTRTLLRWEKGQTPIPHKRMRQLALIYRVSLSELARDPSAR
jgi:transcriptional regulator with XRE-family HTH domain